MRNIFVFVFCCVYTMTMAQNDINHLVSTLLGETPLEENLQELCDKIGGRVTGSEANLRSVDWAMQKFEEAGVHAWKQEFEMDAYWNERAAIAHIEASSVSFEAAIVSKYMSPKGKHKAQLINLGAGQNEDFEKITESLEGKFILVETDLCLDIPGLFHEYTMASNTERLAREHDVKGIVYMSSRPNSLLYRFISSKAIQNDMPQFVMTREAAQRCQRLLEDDELIFLQIETQIETSDSFTSYNVIGEIKGSEKPEEIILIGAHLDSWALGTGANDNGCNVSLIIDLARQMKKLGIIPKRTIRFALWNGEEQGYFGSWAYTKQYEDQLDRHLMATSIDIGSGAIIGFFTNGRDELIPVLDSLLRPVSGLGDFINVNAPIVGTDNFDFMLQGVPNLVGNHQSQVYGPNYHAASDTYDKVGLKSLKINSAIVGAVTLGLANMNAEDINWQRHNRAEIEEIFDRFQLEYQMRMFNVWEPWIEKKRGLKE